MQTIDQIRLRFTYLVKIIRYINFNKEGYTKMKHYQQHHPFLLKKINKNNENAF